MARPDSSDRSAKVAALQKQAKRKDRGRLTMIWGAAAMVLVLIVGAVAFAVINRPTLDAVTEFDDLSRDHVVEAVTYEQSPPPGGDHHPAWLNCGVYTEEVPQHHAVHSLEHGAVWLTYQPDVSADELETLQGLADQPYLLLSPVADQESPVMATAWGVQLEVDSAEDPRLNNFIREYRQGPQTPEPGAACTGGTSEDLLVAEQ